MVGWCSSTRLVWGSGWLPGPPLLPHIEVSLDLTASPKAGEAGGDWVLLTAHSVLTVGTPFPTTWGVILTPNGVFTPEQDNDETNVEPVYSYDAFHTRHV